MASSEDELNWKQGNKDEFMQHSEEEPAEGMNISQSVQTHHVDGL